MGRRALRILARQELAVGTLIKILGDVMKANIRPVEFLSLTWPRTGAV
jgi:hypothetical protein